MQFVSIQFVDCVTVGNAVRSTAIQVFPSSVFAGWQSGVTLSLMRVRARGDAWFYFLSAAVLTIKRCKGPVPAHELPWFYNRGSSPLSRICAGERGRGG